MVRKFRHDALFILLICSWVPVAVAVVLVFWQTQSHISRLNQLHDQRYEQAKITLNSRLLGVEAVAEILLVSRELNDFMLVDERVRLIAGNLLYGRVSSLKQKAPDIPSYVVLDKESKTLFSYPTNIVEKNRPSQTNRDGFFLIDQNTARYYRRIAYDDHELPGPAAQLKGFLVLDIDLRPWRNSLPGSVTLHSLPAQPSVGGIELEITEDNSENLLEFEFFFYLIVLAIVLVAATMIGLYLMRSRIVKPIVSLTHYVSDQMDKAPDYTQRHELAVLKESFKTYIQYEKELKAKLLQQSTLAAIGRTTQMLAHDVRKPFAMLKSLLYLARDKESADVRALIHRLAPEIEKATLSAEELIRNIMEVGANKIPHKQISHLSALIQATLCDALRIHAQPNITFHYTFLHHHALYADPIKTSRILSNITLNAIEVMGNGGKLWFETRQCVVLNQPMVEITIGNSGSFIPEEKREQVFDPFFTEGKHNGTGLGLAIVKKLINDHGGEIYCRSSIDKGTEFVFTLPVDETTTDLGTQHLPANSSELIKTLQSTESSSAYTTDTSGDVKLAEQIIHLAKRVNRQITILVVDDEFLYRRTLEAHVDESDLAPYVRLEFAECAETAMAILVNTPFDIVIMDVHFGKGRLNGFEAVRKLRDDGCSAKICIHSSHDVLEYQSTSIESGANLFMPKPMTKIHFLSIIYSTLSEFPPHASHVRTA